MMNRSPAARKHPAIAALVTFLLVLSLLLSLTACGYSDSGAVSTGKQPTADDTPGGQPSEDPTADPEEKAPLVYKLLSDNTWEVSGVPYGTSDTIVIPASYEGKAVTKIAYNAFACYFDLVDVTVPASVTDIGIYAFSYCTSLTGITIPDSVTSIGDRAFEGCKSLVSITLPAGITGIGRDTFYDCQSLTGITLPSGITSIGTDAFSNCKSLSGIILPPGVESIGARAFRGCAALIGITIPASVTEIGGNAFQYCDSLQNVYFEDTAGWGMDVSDPSTIAQYFRREDGLEWGLYKSQWKS